jgi:hypothetical protein
VIIYAPNSLEYLLASAATRAANAVPIPMNHRSRDEEVSYILKPPTRSRRSSAVLRGDGRRACGGTPARVRLWITLGAEGREWATSLDALLDEAVPSHRRSIRHRASAAP